MAEKFPPYPVTPIWGKKFEYDYAPTDFKSAVLKVRSLFIISLLSLYCIELNHLLTWLFICKILSLLPYLYIYVLINFCFHFYSCDHRRIIVWYFLSIISVLQSYPILITYLITNYFISRFLILSSSTFKKCRTYRDLSWIIRTSLYRASCHLWKKLLDMPLMPEKK